MKDLLAKEEFHLPKVGQIVSGEIVSVSKSSVMVDLGSMGIGVVYPGEFYDNPERMKALQPGEKVSAMLLELENDQGYRELSLRAAQMTTAWQDIKEKKEKGEIIKTSIVNINKGGLIVEVNGVQGFLPLSQLSAEHYPKIEGGDTAKIVQALQKFKGQELEVRILDFSETEGKLIVSERAIREEAAQEELAKLNVGDIVECGVTEVTDFGAFVKLSTTLDGLIHYSEIDWKFVENPREYLHTGDKIKAKVISKEGNRVSLSLKALKENPWDTIESKYSVGQTVSARAIKIRNNGVFMELPGDITGLLPISEFEGKNPAETIEIGKEYAVAIVNLEAKEHKLILTLNPEKTDKKEAEKTEVQS